MPPTGQRESRGPATITWQSAKNHFLGMPLTMTGVSDVSVSDTGAASGLLNTTQQMGGALGMSILVTVFGAATSGGDSQQSLRAGRRGIYRLPGRCGLRRRLIHRRGHEEAQESTLV